MAKKSKCSPLPASLPRLVPPGRIHHRGLAQRARATHAARPCHPQSKCRGGTLMLAATLAGLQCGTGQCRMLHPAHHRAHPPAHHRAHQLGTRTAPTTSTQKPLLLEQREGVASRTVSTQKGTGHSEQLPAHHPNAAAWHTPFPIKTNPL